MASITIRNLDEAVKQALREQAARHGHSMEEEARKLLSSLGHTDQAPVMQNVSGSLGNPAATTNLSGKKILLIIGGGIAAYKCLDLIRRLRERGASVRPVLTIDLGRP